MTYLCRSALLRHNEGSGHGVHCGGRNFCEKVHMTSQRAWLRPWSRRRGIERHQFADELAAAPELRRDAAAGATWQPVSRASDVVVRTLGPLEVHIAGEQVAGWGGQRAKTLLQYLLVHRRPVHREVLMELLWPGHTYSSARNNLNVCLHSLRRVLDVTSSGTRYVTYRDGCYTLNRALSWDIDRDRFVAAAERGKRRGGEATSADAIATLERAVSAYGGPLFDGDPAADWLLAERTALEQLFHQVLERLAALLAARGDLDGAQRTLGLLLRDDGCRESAHRMLMTCYARRGQRDQVARQFQRCVTRLETDLEVTPSAETVDLFRALTRPA